MSAQQDAPGAQPWVPGRPSLAAIRRAAPDCRGCELWADATQVVVGEGPARARLVLLGEQPGDQEDQQGKPFVGPADRLLDRALDEAGIDPAITFRTNAVKHFRWAGTRGKQRIHKSPAQKHVRACRPWLDAELQVVRPEGVVLLGATAGAAVYGPGFRVGAVRGTMQEWPTEQPDPPWVVATTHPSAVLRSREREQAYAGLVADLGVAAAALARE
ncbi:UdgX family uracil-DNA binding protein [Nocardioides massiliensis]|uniref:Type-4 uracil-DNA glycosylase n=1 Tax=Nocardioides massiliensis TaxID=1325935 RepID=A0ABT9NIG2_9ACTN|nr:UdgX family uracil-DNA binding protein [Nocardioides massiliensis]MDP9820203.1 DNA polymerase [Nocardioides massiliensis]